MNYALMKTTELKMLWKLVEGRRGSESSRRRTWLCCCGFGMRWRNTRRMPEHNMRDDQHRFLMLLGQLPARLTAEQAAWVLNCQPHDIPALVAARLLKPLGNPPANGIKFFATVDYWKHKDRNWLVRVSATIYQHWQKKNARRSTWRRCDHATAPT